ncbi:alpha/beta hydrolase [Cellulomonas sp. P24]|uniref:alpha/beta hydrolase n=1 Tax=Cellulomonas sp. P24 TaxID=2885206 RepID=UPI00216B3C09|nr:alpha/beta hydrolase [Cellulomonas sp. P24]MCR6494383.1 alpha/beta hydrolase [Cellulomonas sp. P24]
MTYDPAQSSRVFLPDGASASPAPLVVLVPGGGWVSADPTGLTGLATWLAERGAAVVTISYRTSSDDAYFPVPAEDVACGLADAAARVRRAGIGVGEVVLVGHSAGAQLAAVVALDPGTYSGGCSDPAVVPDRLVGLAGPYDVTRIDGAVESLFGTGTPSADARRAADPVAAAGRRSELAVLLVHGTADGLVPVEQTQRFAAALSAGGHQVTTRYPDGAGHASVYSAGVAGPIIADWLGLGPAPTPTDS